MGRQDILDVMLPWHLGKDGDRELIPPTGMTVAEAAALVRSQQKERLVPRLHP
ncbi:DUF6309 family protein [Streptomyces sp. NPDC058000]|uniref:DUF6309 family protein n=1 Tax=Streptomyces sp. NPDC058000 TaxID=3346299 RepID=UPI0036E16892